MSPMPPVPREVWGASVPLGPPMPRTPTEVWLHWAVVAPSADPKKDMRKIEATGKARFGRFSYSYCYHPPSRRWLVGAGQTVGAHTGGRNSKALGLSLIAAPGADDMPHLVEDTVDLLRWLIDTGRLADGEYPTAGHRDQKPTECPGNKAYALIPDMRAALAGGVDPEEFTMDAEAKAAFDDITDRLTRIENGVVIDIAEGRDDATEGGSLAKVVGSIKGYVKALALDGRSEAEQKAITKVAARHDPTHKG